MFVKEQSITKRMNFKKIVINERVLWGIILAILTIAYSFIWINKSYVLNENWADFFDGLIKQGEVPYRDFYYYMPPFNLLVDHLFLKLSFGYEIIYRLWRLLETIITAEIMYLLLLKRVSPYIACIGCSVALLFMYANELTVAGDCNHTCLLLIALLCLCLFQYVKNINIFKKKLIWLLGTGICGGLMLVTKQTVTLASVFCYTILFAIFSLLKIEKNFFMTLIYIAMGASIPFVIGWCYLGTQHAIDPFLYQVFMDVSSKGTLFSITIGKLIILFQNKFYGILALAFAFIAYILAIINQKKILKKYKLIEIILITLSGAFFGYYYISIFIESWKVIWSTGIIFLFLIQLVVGICLNPTSKIGKYGLLVAICLTAAIWICNPNNITVDIFRETSLFVHLPDLTTLIFIFLLLWEGFHIFKSIIRKEKLDMESLIIASAGIVSGFTFMMSDTGMDVPAMSGIIIIPAFIFIIFKNKNGSIDFATRILQVSLLLLLGVCISQKLVCHYSWWGNSEASYWEKTEKSDIHKLAGIKFSPQEKKRIDGLYNLIDYYTDDNSVIWGFPYIKLYNYLLDNYNMNGFVPVTFYDVCADDYAIYEAEMISINEPDIVVWVDIPGCMEVHESVFRGGKQLGQRKIQKWFAEVKDSDYTLIGQVGNVFVYKFNDGTKVSHTYIEHKTSINSTAINYNVAIQENDKPVLLSGNGTLESPYLITSTEDFITFRDLVNSGINFSGQYIRQTTDIDLKNYRNWEPIGIFGSENLFEGIYDGDGYLIKGLYIDNPDDNVALFGQLAGTLINVSVVDCNVTGNCIGGVASHGVGPTSRIINCCVTGVLYSYGRSGGIADNLGGPIINCVTNVKLGGNFPSGVSGYYTNTVINCYSTQGKGDISLDDGMQYTNNSVNNLNSYLKELEDEDYGQLLNEWQIKDGKFELTHKY